MEAVAALREGLLPLGWTRSDEKNYALVIHPMASMAINVASGDLGTGIPTASVATGTEGRQHGRRDLGKSGAARIGLAGS